MTEEEAMAVLWKNKSPWNTRDGAHVEAFVYATLLNEATMYFGTALLETTTRVAPPGTRVLVTMVSRFGDVGIRDDNLVPPSHGYYTRVFPDVLYDWSLEP